MFLGNFLNYIEGLIMNSLIEEHIEILKENLKLDGVLNITPVLNNFSDKVQGLSKKKKESMHKSIIKDLIYSIQNNNLLESKGLLLMALSDSFNNSLLFLRKNGVFRASKYSYETRILRALIEFIKYTPYFQKVEIAGYFSKILFLIPIASKILDKEKYIKEIIKLDDRFLKTILAEANTIFLQSLYVTKKDPNYALRPGYRTEETIISAVSYLVNIYRKVYQGKKIPDSWSYLINESNRDKAKYNKVIEIALFICQYRELEFEVDIFDYDLRMVEDILYVDKDNFIKARCYGDTKTIMQSNARSIDFFQTHQSNIQSLQLFMEQIWDVVKDEDEDIIYQIKSYNNKKFKKETRRIICHIYYQPKDILFTKSELFSEEVFLIHDLALENYMTEISNIALIDGITIHNIILIQRLYAYISFIYLKVAEKIKNTPGEGKTSSEKILRRSVLPTLGKKEQVELIQYVTKLSAEHCEKLIDELTLDLDDTDSIVDLQYKPIVKSQNQYLILPTVLAYSKLVRSLAKQNNVHLSITREKKDQMIEKLSLVFKEKGFLVLQDFEYGKDEVDLVLLKNNVLFIFECKNPYYPTDSYELANTFGHIETGFAQLRKIKGILGNNSRFKNFIQKTQYPINANNIDIFYGLINANRALTGYSDGEFSVFHAAELINFVESGTISLSGNQYFCWENDEFDTRDLIKYLQGQIVSRDFIDTGEPYPECYATVGMTSIIYKKFAFDYIKLKEKVEGKYRLK